MIVMVLFLAAICATNAWYGWRWSQLDHNPWIGRPFGGMFSGMARPGFVPSRLGVDQINARGRRMLYSAPIAFVVVTLFIVINP